MGKRFTSILRGFESPSNGSNGSGQTFKKKSGGKVGLAALTPEERQQTLHHAHETLRNGQMVFMDAATVEGFKKLLNTEINATVMRRLLTEIATGGLTLTRATKGAARPVDTKPQLIHIQASQDAPPMTLRQAAVVLNTNPNRLYYRCMLNRISHVRYGKKYLIPATEIERLRVIGIY